MQLERKLWDAVLFRKYNNYCGERITVILCSFYKIYLFLRFISLFDKISIFINIEVLD